MLTFVRVIYQRSKNIQKTQSTGETTEQRDNDTASYKSIELGGIR